MRVTIIKSGGVVAVDGVPVVGIDTSSLPDDFHALQWYGDSGDLELMDPVTRRMSNMHVTTIDPYKKYIDAHKAYIDALL